MKNRIVLSLIGFAMCNILFAQAQNSPKLVLFDASQSIYGPVSATNGASFKLNDGLLKIILSKNEYLQFVLRN